MGQGPGGAGGSIIPGSRGDHDRLVTIIQFPIASLCYFRLGFVRATIGFAGAQAAITGQLAAWGMYVVLGELLGERTRGMPMLGSGRERVGIAEISKM